MVYNNSLSVNLKVLLMDTDFYALMAINGYLAYDRRTRVTALAESTEKMWEELRSTPQAELPDVVVLDTAHIDTADILTNTINQLRQRIPKVRVICITQAARPELIEAAAAAQANGYLLKQEVRLQIAGAIVYTLTHDFVITEGIREASSHLFNTRIFHASLLPEKRDYPELTDRIRQAIELCVIEGMPAHLGADEMGISLHTIRGYIKEGYRILESYDETDYPNEMTPQERAFMRYTALADE
jgi:DNA-binding NarL/FixJ family response regulator